MTWFSIQWLPKKMHTQCKQSGGRPQITESTLCTDTPWNIFCAKCCVVGHRNGRTCMLSLLPNCSVPGPVLFGPCGHSESIGAVPNRDLLNAGSPCQPVTLNAHPACVWEQPDHCFSFLMFCLCPHSCPHHNPKNGRVSPAFSALSSAVPSTWWLLNK